MLQIIQLRRTGLYLAQLNYIYIGSSHLKSMLQNIQVKTHMSLFRSTRPAYIGSSHPRQKTRRSLLRSTRTKLTLGHLTQENNKKILWSPHHVTLGHLTQEDTQVFIKVY